ncbi:MAG: fluoride efflux transporter CrcB [Burkholderiales bacterium]|nr:fluoride efflux transporter CrcB [Burkholderiales bacterium]
MNFTAFAAVGIGAMFGAWSRWGLALALNQLVPALPMGTLVANLAGGFMIGAAFEYFIQHTALAPEYRLMFITGFLGSLTTFSAFSLETVMLLQQARYGWALLLISSHLIGSLAMTLLGIFVVRALAT